MREPYTLIFGPFRLDSGDERLWCEEEVLRLTHKAFAVLRYLVEHPEQLVTKEALFETVWPDTYVSDAALAVCIREIRQALRDSARTPQFIETVHGRGYRFIAPVTAADQLPATPVAISPASSAPGVFPLRPQPSVLRPVPLVGRDAELTRLSQWFATALGGKRQISFITGEAGMGKTTLVDAFIRQIESQKDLWIGHGQCIDQYGAGEAYLPLLEAFGRLGRVAGGAHLIDVLRQQAPSWLVQMPALLSTMELEALQGQESEATRERMLRELAEAIEALTVERPLVLILEDLHWSDISTLNWLAFVARRRETARLLVVATYRPAEVMVQAHPLQRVTQELRLHELCDELALAYLSESAVAAYLSGRFGEKSLPTWLIRMIHRRTNGNPLFMINVVDEMVRGGRLREGIEGWELQETIEDVTVGVPESLRQLIEQQLDQVRPEAREILEVASVAGSEFSAAAVAAGVDQAVAAVETQCAALARQGQFVRTRGTAIWPDGTVATRYGFIHALYQEVLYERVPVGRRVRLHQQIGIRTETGHGTQAREIAAELAVHFERGQDVRRTVQYLQYAGENALHRNAHQEAIMHLTKGLELLITLPDTSERLQQELGLQTTLGPALMAVKGYGAPDVEHAYTRARELCQQMGETPRLLRVLGGLQAYYLTRAELQTARELGEQCLRLIQGSDNPRLLNVHCTLGQVLFHLGELAPARAYLEQGIALYTSFPHVSRRGLQDPGVACLSYAAWTLWLLGYSDQALQKMRETLTLSQELSHPFSQAFAECFAAVLHHLRQEGRASQERAEAAIDVSTEQRFAYFFALGTMLQGRALVDQGQGEEGIARIREGLEAYQATGAELARPHWLLLLAEAYGKVGQAEEGLSILTEALTVAHQTGERVSEAELYRLKGELLQHAKGGVGQAGWTPEACFLHALDIARLQQAKSQELRVATSLCRLWQQRDKRAEARQLLAEVYGWFTEGFDTADLLEAKALLEELSRQMAVS